MTTTFSTPESTGALPTPDPGTYVPPATPTTGPSVQDRLVRPRNGRRLGGVCAGIADKYGWSRTTVRLLALVSILFPGPQVLAYIIAWIVIPDAADQQRIVDIEKVKHDVKDVANI
jgi:phage shock protein PspC (stress-responsive transcriptional regulator)